MNYILNRFFTKMPSNCIYGWGNKIDKIDLMRVIATSKHKRKLCIMDRKYPWTVKVKYIDNYRNLNHPQITSSSYNYVFINPFTNPIITNYIDQSPSGTDNIVITYRFDNENSASKFINDMNKDIKHINNCIERAILDAQNITHKN